MKIVLVDGSGNLFGIKEKKENIPHTPINISLKGVGEELMGILKLYPEAFVDDVPSKEGEIEIEVLGIEREFIGFYYKTELRKETILFGLKEDEEEIRRIYEEETKCRFLGTCCTLRKDGKSCEERKSLGECPIDRGIPGGSVRDIWGMWLDHGGDKDIDFMNLTLKDLGDDVLKEMQGRIKISGS